MSEPQGSPLRLRRPHPHTRSQPRGRRTSEAGDSWGPGADEPSLRDQRTNKARAKTPASPRDASQQKHDSTTVRPAPSTRNQPPKQSPRPGATKRKPQQPDRTPLPPPLRRAVKSKCRVSLARGSVGLERGGPHTVELGRETGRRASSIQKEAGRNGSPQQIRPPGPPSNRSRRKPAVTVRHDRPAPGAHLHQKAWERSLGGPPEASPIPPPPPPWKRPKCVPGCAPTVSLDARP